MLQLDNIDRSWTLFLDRDGVINYEKDGDYIYHPGEFVFYEGAVQALQICSRIFKRLIIVTNQKGVEKGLMTLADLQDVHTHMRHELLKAGVTLDEIFSVRRWTTTTLTGSPSQAWPCWPRPSFRILIFPGL